jgi:hypothetical protein
VITKSGHVTPNVCSHLLFVALSDGISEEEKLSELKIQLCEHVLYMEENWISLRMQGTNMAYTFLLARSEERK